MTTKKLDNKFKIQQLEKQLEAVARMARTFPWNGKYQRKLTYIQNKLMQLRSQR